MKKILVTFLIIGMSLGTGKVFAQMMPGKGMKMHEEMMGGSPEMMMPGCPMSRGDDMKKGEMGMEEMFQHKLKMIWKNSAELGIKEDQMKAIKELKTAIAKDIVMKDAQIEVTEIDLKSKMMDDPLDEKGLTDLLDKKFELKKEKAKAILNACAQLRKILTDEQRGKMKQLMSAKIDKGTNE
jgi:hypothetical protein